MKVTLINADVLAGLAGLPDESVQCVVTSPPYWGLRDYGTPGQIGLEPTIEEYVAKMVEVFREVRRVLRGDGVLFLNLGDSYVSQGGSRHNCTDTLTGQGVRRCAEKDESRKGSPGLKPKDLCGIPWRVALALQADGWYLRSDIIWAKPNPMPESCTDRPTKAHEYIFLLTKSASYQYDAAAISEAVKSKNPVSSVEYRAEIGRGGNNRGANSFDEGTTKKPMGNRSDGKRNARSVWEISTHSFPGAHFATFPPELVRRCVAAGSKEDDVIFDPFSGAGTTALVAAKMGRDAIGIELNPAYVEMSRKRIAGEMGWLAEIEVDTPGEIAV